MNKFSYEQWKREHDRRMAEHAHEMALLDARWRAASTEAERIAQATDELLLKVDAQWRAAVAMNERVPR